MSLEALLATISIALMMASGSWMILNQPITECHQPSSELPEAPQNVTTSIVTQDDIDSITKQFNATGEAVIERYICNHTADVCWRFTREFRKYNPEWSDLTLGIGDAFGKCPHSVAYLRRNNNSAYVHDAWGGDTFVLEFDEAGNFTMWNRIENGSKILDTRNADWLKQYDHFNFAPNERQTTIRAIRQDNRMKFIEGEI